MFLGHTCQVGLRPINDYRQANNNTTKPLLYPSQYSMHVARQTTTSRPWFSETAWSGFRDKKIVVDSEISNLSIYW
jgi:hypothetical protein